MSQTGAGCLMVPPRGKEADSNDLAKDDQYREPIETTSFLLQNTLSIAFKLNKLITTPDNK